MKNSMKKHEEKYFHVSKDKVSEFIGVLFIDVLIFIVLLGLNNAYHYFAYTSHPNFLGILSAVICIAFILVLTSYLFSNNKGDD